MWALFETDPRIRVSGEAENGEEALQQARSLEPDGVHLDLQMPGVNGVEAARRIVRELPPTAILVLTMIEDDDNALAAMRAGARGYLLKDGWARRAAGRHRSCGRRWIDLRRRRGQPSHVDAGCLCGRASFPQLTEREREILDLVARGLANSTIALRLGLSEKTVRNNVCTILTKLRAIGRRRNERRR